MGAVSGDVNTLSMRCADAADLASRPIAALRDGDRAYVVDKEETAEGPLFFLNRGSVAAVDGTGVLATAGGVGRWLSESLYGSGTSRSTLRTVQETSSDAAWQAPTAPGTFTEITRIPAGFIPQTEYLLFRASASFTRGDAGVAVANVTVRMRRVGVGNIAGFKVGTVGAGACTGGEVERVIGPFAPNTAIAEDIILEWTSDAVATWAMLGGISVQQGTLTMQEINFVPAAP